MASNALKISMNYDVLCPQSWIAYQVLQQKLPVWRRKRPVDIEYLPVFFPAIHKFTYGVHPGGMINAKKEYLKREMEHVCGLYAGVRMPKFPLWADDSFVRRSPATLLMLNHLRTRLPEHYLPFLEATWAEYWEKTGIVNRTTHFHRIGRELGIPFTIMDDSIMRIEERTNYSDIWARTSFLNEVERTDPLKVTGCPWLFVYNAAGLKLLSFGEVMRLEMVEELLDDPQKMQAVSDLALMEKARQDEIDAAARRGEDLEDDQWSKGKRRRRYEKMRLMGY